MPCKNNQGGRGQWKSRRALKTFSIKDLAQGRNEWFPCSHLPSPSVSGLSICDQDDQNTTTYRTSCCQRPENSRTCPPSPRQRQIYGPPCQQQREMDVPQCPRRREGCVSQNQRQRETYVPQCQRQINVPYCPRQRGITIPQNQRQRQIGVPQCQGSMFKELQQCRKTIKLISNEALNIASDASILLEKFREMSSQTNQYRVCVGANTNNRNIAKKPSRIGITKSNVRVLPRCVDYCASGEAVESCCQEAAGKVRSGGLADCACGEERIIQKKSACQSCCPAANDQSTSCYSLAVVAVKCECAEEIKKRKKKKQRNVKNTCCPSLVIADKCECEKEMKKRREKKQRNVKKTCCPSLVIADKCECAKEMKKRREKKQRNVKKTCCPPPVIADKCECVKQSDIKDESTCLEETCNMPSCPASNTSITSKCKCYCQSANHK